MRDWLHSIDWTAMAGSALAFAFLILVADPGLTAIAEHFLARPAQIVACTTHECREDLEAASLSYYTELLAWFTAVLAVASIAQGVFLVRADKTARTAANAAMEIGEKQIAMAGLSNDVLEKQKEIDRLRFFAEYRPKMEILFIKKLDARHAKAPDNQPTRAEFVVTNGGAGEALVTGSRVSLEWWYPEDIPIPTDLDGAALIPERRYLAGATDKISVESDQWGGLNEVHGDGRKKLYLLGWVVYVDGRGEEFGATRTTYFGRVFDPDLRLFLPIRNFPDWNLTL